MKKMIGFVIFWIAVGMLLMLFVNNKLIGLILCSVFFLLGYNLFFC